MKRMKWMLPALMTLLLAGAGPAVTGCNKLEDTGRAGAPRYICPMDRDVVQDKPGNCPKCAMKLVEKRAPAFP